MTWSENPTPVWPRRTEVGERLVLVETDKDQPTLVSSYMSSFLPTVQGRRQFLGGGRERVKDTGVRHPVVSQGCPSWKGATEGPGRDGVDTLRLGGTEVKTERSRGSCGGHSRLLYWGHRPGKKETRDRTRLIGMFSENTLHVPRGRHRRTTRKATEPK